MNAATVKCGQDPNQEVGHAHGQQDGRFYHLHSSTLGWPPRSDDYEAGRTLAWKQKCAGNIWLSHHRRSHVSANVKHAFLSFLSFGMHIYSARAFYTLPFCRLQARVLGRISYHYGTFILSQISSAHTLFCSSTLLHLATISSPQHPLIRALPLLWGLSSVAFPAIYAAPSVAK